MSSCSITAARSPTARPAQVRADPKVIAAYLGDGDEEVAEVEAEAGCDARSCSVARRRPPSTAISRRSRASTSRSNEGEIVTLIGANGAGKSTLMMTICGKPRARDGGIMFAGARHHRSCRPTRSRGSASRSRPRAGASFRA